MFKRNGGVGVDENGKDGAWVWREWVGVVRRCGNEVNGEEGRNRVEFMS